MPKHPSLARIVSTGSYVPERVLTNADLEKMVETTDEWITSRTGMKERRIASDAEPPSVMGARAAEQALERAGVTAEELDLILVATMTADHLCPTTAALVQAQLGAKGVPVLDINAACCGFVYGMSIAKAYVESGMYQNVLLIASEKMSAFGDYSDRSTCILWGDGAAAAVIGGRGKGLLMESVELGADGGLAELLSIPAGGSAQPASIQTVQGGLHYIKMQGREVFKHAVRSMEEVGKSCLRKAGIDEDAIRWLVPHQANNRIIEAVGKRLQGKNAETVLTVQKYGNTSASSIALALNELMESKRVGNGEYLLLVAFGGGLTWSGSVLRYEEEGE